MNETPKGLVFCHIELWLVPFISYDFTNIITAPTTNMIPELQVIYHIAKNLLGIFHFPKAS